MSFFDLRRRGANGAFSASMEPPPLTIVTLAADLRWHLKLYRMDRLPVRVIAGFLLLRVLHLAQYKRGWRSGTRDV
jgi:hypothetical protein